MEEAWVQLTEDEKPDFRVRDYKQDAFALCPLTGCDCLTTCMWMRPTGFGEPKCAVMVIADELCNIYAESRKRGVVNE